MNFFQKKSQIVVEYLICRLGNLMQILPLGCMSTRAAANIRDEMEALGPVRLTEVQEAQKQIINVARKLSDDGTIVLAGRGGEEMV